MLVKVTMDAIDIAEGLAYVRHRSCGAVTMFEGNIRDENEGEQVLNLVYEVYENLFQKVVVQIAEEAAGRWAIHKMAIIQRVGLLQVGNTGIAICISSPHRRDALEALSYIIEEFKKRAPVWKKETTENCEKWINWN